MQCRHAPPDPTRRDTRGRARGQGGSRVLGRRVAIAGLFSLSARSTQRAPRPGRPGGGPGRQAPGVSAIRFRSQPHSPAIACFFDPRALRWPLAVLACQPAHNARDASDPSFRAMPPATSGTRVAQTRLIRALLARLGHALARLGLLLDPIALGRAASTAFSNMSRAPAVADAHVGAGWTYVCTCRECQAGEDADRTDDR